MTQIAGFLSAPPKSANGKPLSGRFVCSDVQWTGEDTDVFATFTITAREILAAAESNLLWTDQDVQRGVKPETASAPTELSLANGYPDDTKYVFVTSNSDEIVEKLLYGKKLFLNPLVWNLRPGKFEGYKDDEDCSFHIYSGKIYLPDSHHRHQAIIKAARLCRDSPADYPKFSLDKQFKVDLYFLTRSDEGNFFFDKNQRPRPTAKSKAFDLTTEDSLSLLAKSITENSSALAGNVNRVTDRLTSKNPQVITLSTLREMSKSLVSDDAISESEVEGLGVLVGSFYDMLAGVRPELGHLEVVDRVRVRNELLVDSAVMMHGYAALMKEYMSDIPKLGSAAAKREWQIKLKKLTLMFEHKSTGWRGDLFAKSNPLWSAAGILKPNSTGSGFAQVNNGATRSAAGRILKAVLAIDENDLINSQQQTENDA